MSMLGKSFNWNDLRVFIVIARAGRLGAAAKKLQLDYTTVSRRLGVLERTLGVNLFDRSLQGVTLTRHGQALFDHVEGVETELALAAQDLEDQEARISGVVRLAAPEGLCVGLIAPGLATFHDEYPDVEIELTSEHRAISLSKHEADIVVSIQRPPRGRLIFKKLADYRLGLYASELYLTQHGRPESLKELRFHKTVSYIDDLILYPKHRYLDHIASGSKIVFQSISTMALFHAVAESVGIGLLPHYLTVGSGLRRVLPEVNVTSRLWIMFHANHRHRACVRSVVDFLEKLVLLNQATLLLN